MKRDHKQNVVLHETTFEYLKPTDQQMANMGLLRKEVHHLAHTIQVYVPEGPDRTYALRKLREVGMWLNVAITREADGSPRK